MSAAADSNAHLNERDPLLTPPEFADVQQAANRIQGHIHRTPVLSSTLINDRVGGCLFFKCDNFQKTGAFKFRGACNTIMSLSDAELARGVVTHSSGNHAAALCYAASLRGASATVVMPSNANEVKKTAVRCYGGTIIECEPNTQAREYAMAQLVEHQQMVPVVPFDDARVIAGQGTASLEFFEQVPDLECLIAPVGGGGMLSGSVISAQALKPQLQVYGAEPANADDSYQSLRAGRRCPLEGTPDTLADGLRTSIGKLTFPIIQNGVSDILLASEQSIIAAMRLVWERMKILIEPSSAVALAVLIDNPRVLAGKRTGIILTGGNVDLDQLPWNT